MNNTLFKDLDGSQEEIEAANRVRHYYLPHLTILYGYSAGVPNYLNRIVTEPTSESWSYDLYEVYRYAELSVHAAVNYLLDVKEPSYWLQLSSFTFGSLILYTVREKLKDRLIKSNPRFELIFKDIEFTCAVLVITKNLLEKE